jgi:hypothetical protein
MHAAQRMTLVTRTTWILGHTLIGAAILLSPSKLRAAVDERQPAPIATAIVLTVINLALYIAVSVTNPGRVRSNDCCTTSSLAFGISSPVSSVGGASEQAAGGGGVRGSPPADPLAAGPAPASPSPASSLGGPAVSLSRWNTGFRKVSKTDDGEDEAFHDGVAQLASSSLPDGATELALQRTVRPLRPGKRVGLQNSQLLCESFVDQK